MKGGGLLISKQIINYDKEKEEKYAEKERKRRELSEMERVDKIISTHPKDEYGNSLPPPPPKPVWARVGNFSDALQGKEMEEIDDSRAVGKQIGGNNPKTKKKGRTKKKSSKKKSKKSSKRKYKKVFKKKSKRRSKRV